MDVADFVEPRGGRAWPPDAPLFSIVITMSTIPSAQELYNDAIVIDALNVSNWDSPAVFESLRVGRLTAINATLVTWENFQQAMDHIAKWKVRFNERRDVISQIRSVQDILQAKKDGRVGIILGWQNATPIENDLRRIELFRSLGILIIQLTFHERNFIGNGCYERCDDGLSNFGIDAVREMNRLGILIDLSHCGERTTIEAIENSSKPVAVTHAHARSYCEIARNKTDEALKLLAERGGVVGTPAFNRFLPSGRDSTIEDFGNAVDALVQRVGIDHVGIGTDFTQDQTQEFWDYIGSQQGTKLPSTFFERQEGYHKLAHSPKGLETPDKFPNIADILSARGYQPADIRKILGENWLNLFREVWAE